MPFYDTLFPQIIPFRSQDAPICSSNNAETLSFRPGYRAFLRCTGFDRIHLLHRVLHQNRALPKGPERPGFSPTRVFFYGHRGAPCLSALLRFLVSSERRRVLRRSHPNAVAPSPNRELPGTNGGATIRLKDASSSHAIILATFGTEWEERYNG
jgi:hypothetical protein